MQPSNTPRTITIFLTTGNPNGIKKLEISNRIIRAYVIPRLKLADAKAYDELTHPALYFLFDKEGTKAYIGESENFYDRVKNHDQSKDFWDIAVAFISKDKSLEKGDIKYLESLAVASGIDARQLETINKTVPPLNNLHEFKIPIANEFFEDIKLLTSTLSYRLFDKVEGSSSETDIWYCKGRHTVAKGVSSEAGFRVLADSLIDSTIVPSFASNFAREAAERELRLGSSSTPVSEHQVRLTSDLTFPSVSRASGFCLGRPSNGWIDWKDATGKTMDEVLRKSEKPSP